MLKNLLSLFIALSLGTSVQAQLQAIQHEHQLNLDTFRLDLMRLASPDFAGRGTGQEGYQQAADFVAAKLSAAGLAPLQGSDDATAANPYFVSVPYRAEKLIDARMRLAGKTYDFGDDFFVVTVPSVPAIHADDLVFVGFGQKDSVYADYGTTSLKGKVVVVLPGRVSAGAWEPESWRQQYQRLAAAEPALIIMTAAQYKVDAGRMLDRVTQERIRLGQRSEELAGRQGSSPVPALVMAPKAMKKLLKSINLNASRAQRQRLASVTNEAELKIAAIHVTFETDIREFDAPNVAGMIRGIEESDEYVVLSAHLDHLGMHDGEIYFGADDNGSGSAALLSLARQYQAWSNQGITPRRSIVLLWFSGEENGLLGSRYFASNAPISTDMIIANINVDMIGRHDPKHEVDENYVYLIGADRLSQELHDLGELVNSNCCDISLDYTFNDPKDPNRYYYRSDHYNFAKQGIPSVFFFSGVHADYHKPSDTLDKINFDRIKRVSELILYIGWELAGRDTRLKLN